MKIIPGGVADKAGIKCGINSATVGLDKITDEDVQEALSQRSDFDAWRERHIRGRAAIGEQLKKAGL